MSLPSFSHQAQTKAVEGTISRTETETHAASISRGTSRTTSFKTCSIVDGVPTPVVSARLIS